MSGVCRTRGWLWPLLAFTALLRAVLGAERASESEQQAPPEPGPAAARAASATEPPACRAGGVRAPSATHLRRLSESGLFEPGQPERIRAGVVEFEPRYALWSDGADKRRWLSLPEGACIDTRDPDQFRFPVGARAYKEFSHGGRRLETRIIERTGEGPDDYWMGAFVWNADGTDAELVEAGAADVLGTAHDMPAAAACDSCHGGAAERFLGLSRLQLDADALARFAERGWISHPVPPPEALGLPEPARAALGYLHANCGHCHGEAGLAFRDVDLELGLGASTSSVEGARAVQTGVAQPMTRPLGGPLLRIAPGEPSSSGLLARMRSRQAERQMPPLATEKPDPEGLARVSAWIESLAPASPSVGPVSQGSTGAK